MQDSKLTEVLEEAKKKLMEATDLQSTEELRVKMLGKKGEFTKLLRSMGDMSKEQRKEFGKAANQAKAEFERILNEHKDEIISQYEVVGTSASSGTVVCPHCGGHSENPYVKDADTYDIPVMTLAEICEQYLISPPPLHFYNNIHFLKIDVEGWERQCLEGMNFNKFRPWIICMESTLPGTNIPCYDEWEDILLANNYILAGASGINRYYLAQEAREQVGDFCDANELDKFYKIINYNASIDYTMQYQYLAQTPISKILLLKLKIKLSKYKTLKAIYRTLRKKFSQN